MADKLQTKCGDRIFAYFIDQNGVRVRRFTITGVYQTNLSQYDKTICFCDLYTAVRLNNFSEGQVSGAELTVADFSKLNETEDIIVRKVNRTMDSNGATYSSKTIRELSPQIFSWLDLLDLNVWIILAIMTAVAVVTMISGLLIIILERTTMIGILKALIGKGLLWGNLLGLGLVILQHFTGFVKLDPATYYVDTVPVEINWLFIVALNVATMFIAIVVLIAPSFLISHIHPARSMRYE